MQQLNQTLCDVLWRVFDRLILCRGWTGFLWMDGCTALLEKQLRIIGHACHETEFWGR